MQKQKRISIILCLVFCYSAIHWFYRHNISSPATELQVYWFIPDGLRADPDVFTIFKWAEDGHLPNIKKMMDEGSYGYSIPVYPGHTPTNFATLFTGASPKDHGVGDGPLRPIGYPLQYVARSGFSSVSKKKDPIWFTLEEKNITSTLISIPGSTPPETYKGNIVKGRWSNWGVDFTSIIFQSKGDKAFVDEMGYNERSFSFGKRLTLFTDVQAPKNWSIAEKSYSPAREVTLEHWGSVLYGLLVDTTDNNKEDYSCVVFSQDRATVLVRLCEGEWSDWLPSKLQYQLQKVYQDNHPQRPQWEQQLSEIGFDSFFKIKLIRLGEKDFFRIRFLYDGLNDSLTLPKDLSQELHAAAGPMVDFVDDYPAQLVHFNEDKTTFVEEMGFSFDWHQKALAFFLNKKKQNVIIQNIYSPNQMLTSKWWMQYMDPQSVHFAKATEQDKNQAFHEVLAMYKKVDNILGEALKVKSKNMYVVFSSDHGVAPLNTLIRLNNLFYQKGWLQFSYDEQKKAVIDWKKSKVVFLQSNHVYLHPQGLAGNSEKQNSTAYLRLRDEVLAALKTLKTEEGVSVFESVYTREEAEKFLELPPDTSGDLILVSTLGFLPTEDITSSQKIFESAHVTGYKQSLDPRKNKALWTPFLIMGPGIKPHNAIAKPIDHADQYRLIMNILDQKVSNQGLRDLRQELSAK